MNGTSFIDKVSYIRSMMTYWIWGTSSKVWMVPFILGRFGDVSRVLSLLQQLFVVVGGCGCF